MFEKWRNFKEKKLVLGLTAGGILSLLLWSGLISSITKFCDDIFFESQESSAYEQQIETLQQYQKDYYEAKESNNSETMEYIKIIIRNEFSHFTMPDDSEPELKEFLIAVRGYEL